MSMISKQIDDLRAYAKDRKGELAKLVSDAADTIEMLSAKLSAANMERSARYYHGDWIPCSERLPEDGATVWVTIKGHDVIRCEDGETLKQAIERINKIRWVTQGYWSEEEHGWNDPSYGCPLIVHPIAWMPIDTPEPYKEGQG